MQKITIPPLFLSGASLLVHSLLSKAGPSLGRTHLAASGISRLEDWDLLKWKLSFKPLHLDLAWHICLFNWVKLRPLWWVMFELVFEWRENKISKVHMCVGVKWASECKCSKEELFSVLGTEMKGQYQQNVAWYEVTGSLRTWGISQDNLSLDFTQIPLGKFPVGKLLFQVIIQNSSPNTYFVLSKKLLSRSLKPLPIVWRWLSVPFGQGIS